MPAALFILIGCQLIGEAVRSVFHLPIPGPVIGMFLLAAVLAIRERGKRRQDGEAGNAPDLFPAGAAPAGAAPAGAASGGSALQRTSEALIAHMGLLFVPAGVGVVAEADLLRAQWAPIVAGLVGSTILGLVVTGFVMHRAGRTGAGRKEVPPIDGIPLEARP